MRQSLCDGRDTLCLHGLFLLPPPPGPGHADTPCPWSELSEVKGLPLLLPPPPLLLRPENPVSAFGRLRLAQPPRNQVSVELAAGGAAAAPLALHGDQPLFLAIPRLENLAVAALRQTVAQNRVPTRRKLRSTPRGLGRHCCATDAGACRSESAQKTPSSGESTQKRRALKRPLPCGPCLRFARTSPPSCRRMPNKRARVRTGIPPV